MKMKKGLPIDGWSFQRCVKEVTASFPGRRLPFCVIWTKNATKYHSHNATILTNFFLLHANYTTYKDISFSPDGRYDCVVMMNVLHEIEPEEWPALFHNISQKMKEDSYLVFAEVNALSEGERPHDWGYMILGIGELEKMFSADLKEIHLSEKAKTICVPIKRNYLKNVSHATVVSAIRLLEIKLTKKWILDEHNDICSNAVIPLTQLLKIVGSNYGIDVELVKSWSAMRNKVVHSEYKATRIQCKRIVEGVYKIINDIE